MHDLEHDPGAVEAMGVGGQRPRSRERFRTRRGRVVWCALLLSVSIGLGAPPGAAQQVEADVAVRVDDLQDRAVKVRPINDFVFKIEGEGALYLINTREGAVLVDTGTPYAQTETQMAKVRELATGPIKKIIVTHAHNDHSGGLPRFKEDIDAGHIEFIGHHRYGYMARLQDDLLPYFKTRYKVLYPSRVSLDPEPPRPYWNMEPTRPVFPGADYVFEMGGVKFVVIAPENGGEGEDGVLLWLPESRILFTGDLFGTLYPMFPNLYTVRGEKVRDPLDYIDALDQVLALQPKVIAPTHFRVVEGEPYIRASVTQMRDAVQYVWDETVAGMNRGETMWSLMRDIQLPKELALSQGHGKVSWTVRAAWELITGWYDYETVANLYHVPESAVHADLMEMAGGPRALATRARRYLDDGKPLEAIRLLDVVKNARSTGARVSSGTSAGKAESAAMRFVLEVRIAAVEALLVHAKAGLGNYSEIGLLEADLRSSRAELGSLP